MCKWYGPLVGASLLLAVLGRAVHWGFAETPLITLTLPFSVVPIWLVAPPAVTIATSALVGGALAWAFRALGRRYASVDGASTSAPHMPGCLTALVVAGVALWTFVAVVSLGVFVRSHWFGPWPKLRDHVAAFEVPRGFEQVSTAEAGSEACFISCDEPRISVVLRTSMPPDEACRVLEASVRRLARRVGPPPDFVNEPPGAYCFIEGDLPRVYSDATLTATILSGGELREWSWLLANREQTGFKESDTVAALLFNSGID